MDFSEWVKNFRIINDVDDSEIQYNGKNFTVLVGNTEKVCNNLEDAIKYLWENHSKYEV